MRLSLAAAVLAATMLPAWAAGELPEGVDQLLTCGHVYSLRSADAQAAGDADSEAEFFNMSEALLWQARTTMEAAGYDAQGIQNVVDNNAMMTGFNYGTGQGDAMLEDCLAAWDSP